MMTSTRNPRSLHNSRGPAGSRGCKPARRPAHHHARHRTCHSTCCSTRHRTQHITTHITTFTTMFLKAPMPLWGKELRQESGKARGFGGKTTRWRTCERDASIFLERDGAEVDRLAGLGVEGDAAVALRRGEVGPAAAAVDQKRRPGHHAVELEAALRVGFDGAVARGVPNVIDLLDRPVEVADLHADVRQRVAGGVYGLAANLARRGELH